MKIPGAIAVSHRDLAEEERMNERQIQGAVGNNWEHRVQPGGWYSCHVPGAPLTYCYGEEEMREKCFSIYYETDANMH